MTTQQILAGEHLVNPIFKAFKDTPLLAYRRPYNLRDFLVKAKLKQSPSNNAKPPRKVTCSNDGRCRTCKSTLVNKENFYKIYPALPTVWSAYSLFHGFWQSFVTIGLCNHLMRIISTYVGNTKKSEIS